MDDFDRFAKAVHDHRTIFRGDSIPHSSEAERIANGKLAVRQHIDALARLMRKGGSVAEFMRETLHFHGGSSFGWPVHLIMATADPDGRLSGKDCWDIVLHCRNMPPAPYPGSASDVDPPAIAKKKPKKNRGRPKGSGSLEKADAPIVAKMKDGLKTGKFNSVHAAAQHYAPEAAGSGAPQSKVERLMRRLRKVSE